MRARVAGSVLSLSKHPNKVSPIKTSSTCPNNQLNEAAAALQAMNGVFLGSKQIAVRLHEPKQLRQEKLQQRFSPRTRSGATSPTPSEGGESIYSAFSPDRDLIRERAVRRSSGSYYAVCIFGIQHIGC